MPGDYSRIAFNPEDDFVKVQQQQGRLSLDAEWNLRNDILDRDARVQTIDTMGRAVVPRETPTGFQIKSATKDGKPTLLIGPGRIYVDGIMATNHGAGSKSFDKALEEEAIPATITDDHFADYYKQRYWLSPATIPDSEKQYRVFLDVWRREVTYLQAPEIVEQAVGEETTARVQTVWQVKCAEISDGGSVSCDLPDELTRPTEGRLSTKAVEIPSDENPCILPPRGGYGGRDNRLYRVEMHTSGKSKTAASSETVGVATFKWSRDNGSVAASVEAIEGKILTLTQTKRNLIEEFHAGDWIEILDDELELDGRSGEMHRVKVVRPGSLEIELDTVPSLRVDVDRHTRTIRWDQKGIIRDSAGNIYANVDDFNGVIPVPPPEIALILEAGVQVTFSSAPTPDLPPSDTPFRAQAYWTFAARTADASLERLDSASPLGIHHHFVPLAIVSPSGPGPNREPTFSVQDCRRLWPDERDEGGCACTICVSPEAHNSGKMTIQAAIDRIKETGGTVCLGPGTFELTPGRDHSRVPIEFSGIRKSVRLQGQGDATCLLSRNSESAILVMGSQSVTLSGFKVIALAGKAPEGPEQIRLGAVTLINSIDTTIKQCTVEVWTSPTAESWTFSSSKIPIRGGTAIAVGGIAVRSTIRNNRISARTGILCLSQVPSLETSFMSVASGGASATLDLRIMHNDVYCTDFGIHLGEATVHLGRTDIHENAIADATGAGIHASGIVWPLTLPPKQSQQLEGWGPSDLQIDGNVINGRGHGIVTGSRSVRITSNRVTGGARDKDDLTMGHGIVIAGSRRFSKLPVGGLRDQGCEIRANHVFAIQGHGVFIQSNLHCALVSSNIIEDIAGSGIVMEEGTQAKIVSVENNRVLNVGMKGNLQDVQSVLGIGVVGGEQVGIINNHVIGLDRDRQRGWASRFGIRAFACSSIRIAGNAVSEIGIEAGKQVVGIAVAPSFERLDISGNQIRKPKPVSDTTDTWEALLVQAGQDKKFWLDLNRFPFFVTLPRLAISTGSNIVGINIPSLASVPRGAETIGVDGNLFESPGGAYAARVVVGGSCTFSNNRCIQPSMRATPAVRLEAGALLITNNYVEGHKGSAGMTVKIPDVSGRHALTVVGNICTTDIKVNGSDLDSRWKGVNVLAE